MMYPVWPVLNQVCFSTNFCCFKVMVQVSTVCWSKWEGLGSLKHIVQGSISRFLLMEKDPVERGQELGAWSYSKRLVLHLLDKRILWETKENVLVHVWIFMMNSWFAIMRKLCFFCYYYLLICRYYWYDVISLWLESWCKIIWT